MSTMFTINMNIKNRQKGNNFTKGNNYYTDKRAIIVTSKMAFLLSKTPFLGPGNKSNKNNTKNYTALAIVKIKKIYINLI